jgi:hypothetical protein
LSAAAALMAQTAPVAAVPAQAPPSSAALAPAIPQPPITPAGISVPATVYTQSSPFASTSQGDYTFLSLAGQAGPDLNGKSIQLASQLAKAEKEEDKAKLRGELAATLNELFDQQAKRQAKEVEDLEVQIKKLRSALDKRLNNKPAIVQRRLEQLLQDADGLGWNSSPNEERRMFGGLGGMGGMSSNFGLAAPARRAAPAGATKASSSGRATGTAPSGTPTPSATPGTTGSAPTANPNIPPVSR